MAKNPATTRVVGVLHKAPDIECHVRVIEVENVSVVEFRDFIPSLNEYGRGYWVPLSEETLYGLVGLLTEIADVEKVR